MKEVYLIIKENRESEKNEKTERILDICGNKKSAILKLKALRESESQVFIVLGIRKTGKPILKIETLYKIKRIRVNQFTHYKYVNVKKWV